MKRFAHATFAKNAKNAKKSPVLWRIILLVLLTLTWSQIATAQETASADSAETTMEEATPADTTAAAPAEESLEAMLTRVDQLELDQWKHQEALDLLQQANEMYPDNYEVIWRISRQYTELGQNAPKDDKEALYQQGMDYAKRAVALDSTDVEGHLRWAIVAGRLGLFKGGNELIQLSRDVKEHAEKVIEIDPDNDIAYYILGRWHRKVANLGFLKKAVVKIIYGGLPSASNEDAVENIKKAIELNPDFIQYHLELGRTYAEELDMYAEARAAYQQALDLPATEEEDPDYKKEAAELLEKIKDKN